MRTLSTESAAQLPEEKGARNAAFFLFCIFLVSYFLHMTHRVPLFGAMHLDLILAALTAVAIGMSPKKPPARLDPAADPVSKRLWILCAYIVLTIPFVEWPMSAIRNCEAFAKSLCFFFFVVATVDTTRKLRMLLAVLAATQAVRVLEPLYLHLTSGYWGSFTSLGNWEYMDRLQGAPTDVINPNGLAFVIVMTLPILHFLFKPDRALGRAAWIGVAGAMCYALVLSASRSGFLALVFLCLFAIWRSKQRAVWLTVAVIGGLISVSLMTDLQRERYVSIYSSEAKGAASAHYRVTGMVGDFYVSLRRPFFGHGIGTSSEANANFRGDSHLSHDLYLEAAEEIGYAGLVLLIGLLWSFLRACRHAQLVAKGASGSDRRVRFLHSVADALVVVVAVDLFFSFFSYGLSEPYWYLLGGISVVTARLATALASHPGTSTTLPAKYWRSRRVIPARTTTRVESPFSVAVRSTPS